MDGGRNARGISIDTFGQCSHASAKPSAAISDRRGGPAGSPNTGACPRPYSPGSHRGAQGAHTAGGVLHGLERRDSVRHLATPALVKSFGHSPSGYSRADSIRPSLPSRDAMNTWRSCRVSALVRGVKSFSANFFHRDPFPRHPAAAAKENAPQRRVFPDIFQAVILSRWAAPRLRTCPS